jgi:hypothetical protein
MREYLGAFAYFYVIVYKSIRPHLDIFCQTGAGMYCG